MMVLVQYIIIPVFVTIPVINESIAGADASVEALKLYDMKVQKWEIATVKKGYQNSKPITN